MGGFGQLYPAGAPPFPPLDVPYLVAYLDRRGVHADVIEAVAMGLSTAEVRARLAAMPDLREALVLVRTSLPTIDADLAFAAAIRDVVAPGALGLFGPVVPSLWSRIEQDPSIDFA